MTNKKSPWGNGSSGNGSGGGRKTPWGGSGKPDRQRPGPSESSPDLENVIEGFKKRVSGGGPRRLGGSGGQNPLSRFGPFGIFLILALLWMVSSIFYTVDQQEEAVVLQFGKYSRLSAPGLNFKLPSPIETVIKRKTREVKKIDVGGTKAASLMLTGDENIVDIDFTVLWRINNLEDYIFNVDEPAVAVRAVAESAMREVVGMNKLEDIITNQRANITTDVRDLMQRTLDEYQAGVEIVEVQLQKADPPKEGKVLDAFRDVVNAGQDAETVINEATAYQNDIVPKARGEAVQIIEEAEAYKARVVAEAKGEAGRFKLVLEEYKAAPRVTRQRMYLETIEKLYEKSEKIVLDDNAGSGVVPYLPLDQIHKKSTGAN